MLRCSKNNEQNKLNMEILGISMRIHYLKSLYAYFCIEYLVVRHIFFKVIVKKSLAPRPNKLFLLRIY